MNTKLGLIGPKDSVELMLNIAKDYPRKIEIVPFVYQQVEESNQIIESQSRLIDTWIFTGLAPYVVAKKNKGNKLYFYPKLDGASLNKVLIQIGSKDKRDITKVSIDLLTKKEVIQTYKDLGFSCDDLHVFEYHEADPIKAIVTFHESLYFSGKIEACITSIRSVFDELANKRIPVYRLRPTITNLRAILGEACQTLETQKFKQSQIAVVIIAINQLIPNVSTDYGKMSYEWNRLVLKIEAEIINFAESVSGSFIEASNGHYLIFSTRGSLEGLIGSGINIIDQLLLVTDSPCFIGIGYGDTALAAEENARLALYHSQNQKESCIFLVDDNHTVDGPLTSHARIKYSFMSENPEIIQRLKESGVTVATLNKILSVQRQTANNQITTSNLAERLKMTTRNARRIMNNLVSSGFAEVIGEESPKTKGRPRKIFRIKSDGLSSN